MGDSGGAGLAGLAARACAALALLLAGCSRAPVPAPVVAAAPQPATVTIAPGQTLSGIAQTYHIPLRALAEANHLSPPYRILAGGVLSIPVASTIAPVEPPPAVAAVPAPLSVAAAAPPRSEPLAPAAAAPARSAPPQTVRAAAPTAAEQVGPRQTEPESNPAPVAATHPKPATLPATAAVTPPVRGASFLWPVRGRIVEGFGTGPDGTHNDGINIVAPRGAPVQAVDGGVVAYTGNELRGYGNLILIKHPDGWISAYAHCDLILVKHGQKVARGQVIARVGATGNVSTPQLHFELRRGDKPVDPRGHLAPPANAAAAPSTSG